MLFYLSKFLWFIFNPFNIIIFLLLGGIIFYFLKFAKTSKVLFIFCFTILLSISFANIGKYLIYKIESKYYNNITLPKKIDGILILGGATNPSLFKDFKQVNVNDSAERIIEAVKIINQNNNIKVVFSGGSGIPNQPNLDHSSVVKVFFGNMGIETSKIIFESKSRNTYENIINSKKIANPNKNNKWLLITSAFHMRRAMLIAEKNNWKFIPYPVDFKINKGFKIGISFDLLSNLIYFNNASHEWIGLISYYFMGRTSKIF